MPASFWRRFFATLIDGILLSLIVSLFINTRELTYGVGTLISMIMIALREDKRPIHDIIAGTKVIRVD